MVGTPAGLEPVTLTTEHLVNMATDVGQMPVIADDIMEVDLQVVDSKDVGLGSVGLREANLGDIDLRTVDLGNVDLGTVDLGNVDTGLVDSGLIDLRDVDLGGVELRDVDDLFGEDTVQPRPMSKQAQCHIDDLRGRGCCQALTWGKSGCIASITPDGQTLEFRFLRCNRKDGSWELGSPTTCTSLSGTSSAPLVHLAWAPTLIPSSELAVFDALGRVSILTFTGCLNRPFLTRRWDSSTPDPVDDMRAIVGCYWLPLMPPNRQNVMLHGPAVKTEHGYQYQSQFLPISGPWHPLLHKSALLCVTTNGLLKLFFAYKNKIEEVSVELDVVNGTQELVTHAAMTSDSNSILMALASTSSMLYLIRITIHWGSGLQADPKSQNIPSVPVITETHLATTSLLDSLPGDSLHQPSMLPLSHLEILTGYADGNSRDKHPPTILAVRSQVPAPGEPYPDAQTVIDRWSVLLDQRQTLCLALEKLATKKNSSGLEAIHSVLHRQPPFISDKLVIDMSYLQNVRAISLSYSDGSFEFRDRSTMADIYEKLCLDTFMTLNHIGFAFPENLPCLRSAFSPSACSVVQMSKDGKLRWIKLEYGLDDIGVSRQDPIYSAMVAALAITVTPFMSHMANFDDVLAIARPHGKRGRFMSDFVGELIRVSKTAVDYSEDNHHDMLMRNLSLQTCLSILNSLGFSGLYESRPLASKLAYLALHARNVVVLITIANKAPTNLRDVANPMDEPEVVDTLAGCVQWSLELLWWMSDCLFALFNDPFFMSLMQRDKFPDLLQFLQARNNPAIHMVLCSSTRGLLAAICRRLTLMETVSKSTVAFYDKVAATYVTTDAKRSGVTNFPLYRSYQRIHNIMSLNYLRAAKFEAMLNELAADISTCYQMWLTKVNANHTGTPLKSKNAAETIKMMQTQCEAQMLVGGLPPVQLLPAMWKLMSGHLVTFRNSVDQSKLFFAGHELLEIDDDKVSLEVRRARRCQVDVFKRTEVSASLRGGGQARLEEHLLLQDRQAQPWQTEPARINRVAEAGQSSWRRCCRCASVMEEVAPQPAISFLLNQQRKCACGGNWYSVVGGELNR